MTAPAQRSGKWRDLMPRLLSAVVMVTVGLGAVFSGPLAFSVLVGVVGLIGFWELARMRAAKRSASGLNTGDRQSLWSYLALLLLGCFGLILLSFKGGLAFLLFAIGLVVVTDSLGYLVGKTLGGPRFWPRVSPNKTWAGIAGGWIGAALFGFACYGALSLNAPSHLGFVILCILLSFASQLGDMAESALKRRMGVKDSSNIIPGHGGVLDRFDALLALGALYALLALIFG